MATSRAEVILIDGAESAQSAFRLLVDDSAMRATTQVAMQGNKLPEAGRGRQLLNKREVADLLQVSIRTVEEYQRRGLPYYRLGPRRNRYDLVVVLDWLNSRCRIVRCR